MCGRTSCHLPWDVLARACAYRDRGGRQRLPDWRQPEKYCPSYNQSPHSCSPVLLSRLHLEKVTLSAPAAPVCRVVPSPAVTCVLSTLESHPEPRRGSLILVF